MAQVEEQPIVKNIRPESSFPGPFQLGSDAIEYSNVQIVNGNNRYFSGLANRSMIHNNVLYFNANDGVNGRELWKSDGTEAGTVLVKNISDYVFSNYFTQAGSDPRAFYVFNGNVVFMAANNAGQFGLYKTDGTTANTTLIKDNVALNLIDTNNPPVQTLYSYKNTYAVLNNILYFDGKGTNKDYMNELWASDGTPEGTKLFKNLSKGTNSTNPTGFYSWNGSLFFRMFQEFPNSGFQPYESELWKFTPAPCTTPAPAGPLATAPTILASYPATIQSNGCLGTVRWYAASTGGTPIFTGDNYTTPLLNATTTYYLSCTLNNCESQRSPATVTVNQPVCTTLPAVPSSAGGSVVNGNSITLSAVGCTEQTRWYGQASGGAILAQTPTFTTPMLTTPTTYYPVCFVLGCESPRTVLDNIAISPSSGQALDFDGVDDAVTIPTHVGFNSLSFTIESYARFDINNRSQTIMDNNKRWLYYNYAVGGSSIKFGFDDNGTRREVGFSFTPTVGNWYHLACTFNNTTKECSFYINGELQDVQTLNFTPNATNTGMKLGGSFTATGYELDGRLEEARYWNIARTETQIGANYNTELSGNESGLVFYYKFDGNVQDCSPNLLHGTREGATGINNLPQFFNTSVALTDVACGINNCTPPTITIGSNTPVCVGGTLNLTSSGGTSYSWTGVNSFTSTAQNPSISGVNALASGTYMVTVTNVNGCTATATTSVTINSLPIPTIGSNSPQCVGNTLNLTSSGGTSYSWTGVNSFTSTAQNPSISGVNALASGTYMVAVTNVNGCTATATTSVTISTSGIPTANGVTITSGNTASITASGCTTYKWYNLSTGGSLLFTGNPFISPALTTNTTYHVACADAPCPETSRTAVLVTVSGGGGPPQPGAIVGGNAACQGRAALNYSVTAVAGATSYTWTYSGTGATFVGGINNTRSVTVDFSYSATSGTMSVTANNASGSSPASTMAITISTAPPAPTANGVTIASGNTASLTATGCSIYKWYSQATGGTVTFTGQNFTTPNLTSTTNYYVACNPGYSCESPRVLVTVTVPCTQMISVKTGAWNDPTVWSCNRIPTASDNVIVETGHIVTVPAGTFQVKNITERGTLSLATSGILNVVGGS